MNKQAYLQGLISGLVKRSTNFALEDKDPEPRPNLNSAIDGLTEVVRHVYQDHGDERAYDRAIAEGLANDYGMFRVGAKGARPGRNAAIGAGVGGILVPLILALAGKQAHRRIRPADYGVALGAGAIGGGLAGVGMSGLGTLRRALGYNNVRQNLIDSFAYRMDVPPFRMKGQEGSSSANPDVMKVISDAVRRGQQ
jgi:hypothetical protein